MTCKHCKPQPKLVAVYNGGLGLKCNVVKGCKRKTSFYLCGDDGKNKLSRLRFTSCTKHLPLGVRKLHKEQGSDK